MKIFTLKAKIIIALPVLLLAVVWNACTIKKVDNRISFEKARVLRDSAYNYPSRRISQEKCDAYYDTLFTSKYAIQRDYFDAGQVAAGLGNYKKCIALWRQMLKVKPDTNYDWVSYLPDKVTPVFDYYEGLIHYRKFNKLWKHFRDYPLDPRLSHKDSVLVKKLDLMFIADQQVRINYRNKPTKENDRLWGRCDSVNEKTMDSIIVNRGIITTKELGYRPSRDFIILFVHLPDSLIIKNMPMINAAFKHHGISKPLYALVKDRDLVYQNRPQLYGTQLHLDTITKQYKFFPIEDVSDVDKRRKTVGLTALRYYAQQYKASLPDQYPQ